MKFLSQTKDTLIAALVALITLITFSIFLVVSCTKKADNSASPQGNQDQGIHAGNITIDSKGLSLLEGVIKTTKGNITLKFYPQKAPKTVTRIIKLIQKGFYDGLVFHRVIPHYIIQSGDPTGTGRGGSGKNIPAEFNDIQHIHGTVAMARATDIHSADSQFYIALTTLNHLDGKYTVFGQVVEGLEILEKINQGDKIISFSLKNSKR